MPSHTLRVLVVDDEPIIADTLALIVSQGGDETLAVYGGIEAIEAAKAFKPHVLLTDVMMPDLDGAELARHFGCHHKDCRIVLMSANPDGSRIAQNLISQGYTVQFLQKPVLPQTVLTVVAGYRKAE
jgi:CheY-like chemotaxis protein